MCSWFLSSIGSKKAIGASILKALCEVHTSARLSVLNDSEMCKVLVESFLEEKGTLQFTIYYLISD